LAGLIGLLFGCLYFCFCFCHKRDRSTYGSGFTRWHRDYCQITFIEGLNVHIRLIRLNHDHSFAFLNAIAWGFNPRDYFAFGHRGTEGGHEDFVDHEVIFRIKLA
jgi:hypothetical protein